MKKIELNKKILEQNPIYTGYESNIYKDGKILYKIFKTDDKKLLENKMKKLELINNMAWLEKCFISMPVDIIMANENFIGYTYYDKPDFKTLNSFDKKIDKKIDYLKKVKEIIVQLHDNNIIFGDIKHQNILYKNGIVRFCDYDNINISGYNFDETNYSEEVYIKKFGIDKTLDIYMYNLLVISNLTRIVESYATDYIEDKGLPNILNTYENQEVAEAMINLDDKDKIQFFKFKEKRYRL